MRIITTTFALIFLLVSCNNDDQGGTTKNVNKRLKSIKTFTSAFFYEYGSNNFISKEHVNYGGDRIVGTVEYIYNSKNQIIEINQQSKNKEVDGTFKNFVVNINYQYSNEILISSIEYFGYLEETGRNEVKSTYEYNNGNLVKKIEETTDSFNNYYNIHTFYTYSNNKLISAESKLFENGAYIPGSKIVTYTYDTKVNPEYNLFPKSYLMIKGYNVNNIISYFDDQNPNASYDDVITYDKDDFPEKKLRSFGNGNQLEYLYEYE
ncbi:hypothetical protein [Paenimyroides aestuarii]|uniref:DUF4595 domain-containing protein n=1 Tax=Paenimyroides aestuarii TaxID=2968490 RepID=A0ABY5NP93_9FLAO|nr:hypothetical protein [Paenimyroides aestuarii]UUV20249.1 hypothetical protein NPX36_07685 [Paenimyroides aestuarii]